MFIVYACKERKVRTEVIFIRQFNPCGFIVNLSIMISKFISRSSVSRCGAEIFITKDLDNCNNELHLFLR